MPGQWEFQVGPAVGVSAGDQLWVARYILEVELPPPAGCVQFFFGRGMASVVSVCFADETCSSFPVIGRESPRSPVWSSLLTPSQFRWPSISLPNTLGFHISVVLLSWWSHVVSVHVTAGRLERRWCSHQLQVPIKRENFWIKNCAQSRLLSCCSSWMCMQHQVDEERRRVRGDQEGDQQAGPPSPGAHRRVRGRQRAPPHRPPRDRRHQHLHLGEHGETAVTPLLRVKKRAHLIPLFVLSCQGVANRGASVRVGRDTEKEGKGERGRSHFFFFLLLLFPCGHVLFRLGSCGWSLRNFIRILRGQEAGVQHGPLRGDLADRGDDHPVGAQPLQRQGRRGSLILRRRLTGLCVWAGLRRWQMRLTLSETWDDDNNNSWCVLVLVLDNEPRTLFLGVFSKLV